MGLRSLCFTVLLALGLLASGGRPVAQTCDVYGYSGDCLSIDPLGPIVDGPVDGFAFRYDHSVVSNESSIVVYGGHDKLSNVDRGKGNQILSLGIGSQNDTWLMVSTSASYGRYDHTSIVYEGSMYVFGGASGVDPVSDSYTHVLLEFSSVTDPGVNVPATSKCTSWKILLYSKEAICEERQSPSTTWARGCHSAVIFGSQMVVFGGRNNEANSLSDTLMIDLWERQRAREPNETVKELNWTTIATSGDRPAARYDHSAVLHAGEMFVFGGVSSDPGKSIIIYNDLIVLLLAAGASQWRWTNVMSLGSKTDAPAPRHKHTANMYLNYMLVFGGRDNSDAYLNDMYFFNLEKQSNGAFASWQKVKYTGVLNGEPENRADHASAVVGDKLYITGGSSSFGAIKSVEIYPLCGCGLCTPGQYANNYSCINCPDGFHNEVFGAPNKSSCIACKPGYFSKIRKGYGAKQCDPCGTGKFTNDSAMNKCIPCAIGKYSNRLAAADCPSCEIGRYSNEEGLPTCKLCQKGRFNPRTNRVKPCQECYASTYNDFRGKSNCTICPYRDMFSRQGAIAVDECQFCIQKRFCRLSDGLCHGNRDPRSTCNKCIGGTFRGERGVCIPCPPNSKSAGHVVEGLFKIGICIYLFAIPLLLAHEDDYDYPGQVHGTAFDKRISWVSFHSNLVRHMQILFILVNTNENPVLRFESKRSFATHSSYMVAINIFNFQYLPWSMSWVQCNFESTARVGFIVDHFYAPFFYLSTMILVYACRRFRNYIEVVDVDTELWVLSRAIRNVFFNSFFAVVLLGVLGLLDCVKDPAGRNEKSSLRLDGLECILGNSFSWQYTIVALAFVYVLGVAIVFPLLRCWQKRKSGYGAWNENPASVYSVHDQLKNIRTIALAMLGFGNLIDEELKPVLQATSLLFFWLILCFKNGDWVCKHARERKRGNRGVGECAVEESCLLRNIGCEKKRCNFVQQFNFVYFLLELGLCVTYWQSKVPSDMFFAADVLLIVAILVPLVFVALKTSRFIWCQHRAQQSVSGSFPETGEDVRVVMFHKPLNLVIFSPFGTVLMGSMVSVFAVRYIQALLITVMYIVLLGLRAIFHLFMTNDDERQYNFSSTCANILKIEIQKSTVACRNAFHCGVGFCRASLKIFGARLFDEDDAHSEKLWREEKQTKGHPFGTTPNDQGVDSVLFNGKIVRRQPKPQKELEFIELRADVPVEEHESYFGIWGTPPQFQDHEDDEEEGSLMSISLQQRQPENAAAAPKTKDQGTGETTKLKMIAEDAKEHRDREAHDTRVRAAKLEKLKAAREANTYMHLARLEVEKDRKKAADKLKKEKKKGEQGGKI